MAGNYAQAVKDFLFKPIGHENESGSSTAARTLFAAASAAALVAAVQFLLSGTVRPKVIAMAAAGAFIGIYAGVAYRWLMRNRNR